MTTPRLDSLGLEGADSTAPVWLRAWNRFWFARIDPTGLGLMRILCGVLALITIVTYSYDLFSYLGPHSWLDQKAQDYWRKEAPIWVPEMDWTQQPHPADDHGQYIWSIYYHVHDPSSVVVVHAAIVVVLVLFTLGLWTRVTSVLAWVGALQYVQRLPTSMFGMDTMLNILLLYLMIGDSGAALSLDRWLQRRRERRDLGPRADLSLKPSWSANFAIRLVQIHFCIIYLTSGSTKLLGSTWWGATALWLCLANTNFAPMRVYLYNEMLIFLCQHLWLWQLFMTGSAIFTLFTEIGFIFLAWRKGWRPIMVTCSVMLHLGIGLIMGLTLFSLLMLVMVFSFVPPDSARIFVDDLIGRLRRRSRAKESPGPAPAPVKPPLVLTRT
jgi:hypothetical protein